MEEWKAIPDYEGLYEASNYGQIRTAMGKTTSSRRFAKRVWKQRILKQKYRKRRYGGGDFRVELWRGNTSHTYLVARLVALTWCDGYMEGMTVNHIDGNPKNNRADNLEWVSIGDNIRHGFDAGLYSMQKKTHLISTTNETCYQFRSMSQASKWLGKSAGYISNIICRGQHLVSSADGKQYLVFITE